jgi:hypothetical protein
MKKKTPYFLLFNQRSMDYEDSIRCSPTGIMDHLPAGKATKA